MTELQVYHLYHVWNVKTVRRVTTLCVNIIASLVPENSEALQSMWLFLKKNAVKFEDSVSFEQGAFFEPATVALHGLERVDFKGGKTVAILGGGTIGMFVMQWAKIFGAKEVVVFDISDERLELGKRLGATAGINTLEEDFMDKAMALTGGKGYDYVYETAGNSITIKMAFQLAANKAQVCCVGTPTKEVTFSVKEWENLNRKEFILTGSWMSYSAPFHGT